MVWVLVWCDGSRVLHFLSNFLKINIDMHLIEFCCIQLITLPSNYKVGIKIILDLLFHFHNVLHAVMEWKKFYRLCPTVMKHQNWIVGCLAL
jgi:hypothetical protein